MERVLPLLSKRLQLQKWTLSLDGNCAAAALDGEDPALLEDNAAVLEEPTDPVAIRS